MAGPTLQIMLQKLDTLLVEEEQLLAGVSNGVKDVRAELESIMCVLRGVDGKEDEDGTRAWVRQVREIAYDIEDVLEDFTVHLDPQARGHGLVGFLRKCAHSVRHFRARHRIATAIREIKTRVQNIASRRNMYAVGLTDEGASSKAGNDRLHNRHVAALFVEEAELVGIGQPREELIEWLVAGEVQLKVMSVVGMGGLGKTTLVRKVYDDERVKGCFNCYAWIAVTQSFRKEDILRSIITQFYGVRNETLPERINKMDGIQLMETLRLFLEDKRYVIVLDDVWRLDAWDILKYALPNNRRGSRILVTTRIGDVGLSCQETCGRVYNLQKLPPAKAWSLFCRKAFRNFPGGACPPEFEDLSRDVVKMCDGLPLALVAIGGLLSKKESFLEWKTLHDNLHSELANNPKLEPIKRILSLSYNDLPHHLKSCFLYFSVFPKDYAVKRITLIRLWIAEGFVESDGDERMEHVAVEYLNDLIDRSMVQVAEHYDYGRIRSCRVHDLIHDIVVLKSKEENFSASFVKENRRRNEKIRRVSIHNSKEGVLEHTSLSHLRAFFLFGKNSFPFSSVHDLFNRFRLLRVLDLEEAPIERFAIEFGRLRHLRYLSLRNTKISKLSKSIGKLQNLEHLDLKGTYVCELPKSILKLRKLRHLLAYQYYTGRHPTFYYTKGVKVPKGIGRLKELQKLTYLEANEDTEVVRELGNLTQLKRLGIVKLRREDGAALCGSIEKLSSLRSFSVTSIGMDELLDLKSLSSPPPDLQRLYLRGPLQTLPYWVSTLRNLVRMRLRWSRLKDDSLGALQGLPNLVELTLIRAYDGLKLYCERGGFKKLQILDLEQLDNLRSVVVDGAMPSLRKMYIRGCLQLEAAPLGIEKLRNLKELHLFDMPGAFVERLRRNGGADRSMVHHVPIIRSYDDEDRIYEEL
ncbi:disease resistance protein RPM1-like [Iris pallida]|uniref:Disease resistance protein RPM1-like n=1 Tax=Iris pallida TaxID=29817 RepID=A0AAX6E8W9_IRIPA|nr:disease resistance protein RPM1-like [Iris pallida]